ncbi:MoaD/ThiS family protein [Fictibacillus aquaticus]|uniref:Molybdopterin synthase sulfur carrier subunit n=1 Tax=Fictibacillus aquaticus TaxID=2021314 RepID=A0A235F5I5_9BACL|nr:MoaD/ThiS family protein [Fictibacillus aquaticus]OYD56187.1 hypothetical protein CGZ90_18820 [Fictibacillus aquaticus]
MIKVLCFAHIKELTGSDELLLENEELTVQDFLQDMHDRYGINKDCMVAVNEEYAEPGDVMKSGDTVALIPPVSGG